MKTVTDKLLSKLSKKAKNNTRKRNHYLFHEFSDPVQRMVNSIEPGTYIVPHKHEDPDKIEAFVILKGRAACFEFDDSGEIIDLHVLSENGPEYAVDIPPRTWHTFISLKSGTSLFEVVQGPYQPDTHKNIAPWAPAEEKGGSFIKNLESEVKKWKKNG